MALTTEALHETIVELASRPGHEKVRALLHRLLVDEIGASSTEVDFERRVPEVHGRIDALLGRTVFELKRDLRREMATAEEELTRYLADREGATHDRFIGIATDGAQFTAFELRAAELRRLDTFVLRPDHPRELLAWLSSAVSVSAELAPTPEVVERELGKGSIAWYRAREDLRTLWDSVSGRPDVQLKRGLWSRMLERVYGSPVDDDELFFQHTYLSIVAKTMATHILGIDVPAPEDLLSGHRFQELGIGGAVEADFFNWVLDATGGDQLVARLAMQSGRFRLRDVDTDVLKGLYESLVDPAQRHDLGEYYTPDWLAAHICEHVIDDPLRQRVLDPACGSGTFLFHAIRLIERAAGDAGWTRAKTLAHCLESVTGIDVHPLAESPRV